MLIGCPFLNLSHDARALLHCTHGRALNHYITYGTITYVFLYTSYILLSLFNVSSYLWICNWDWILINKTIHSRHLVYMSNIRCPIIVSFSWLPYIQVEKNPPMKFANYANWLFLLISLFHRHVYCVLNKYQHLWRIFTPLPMIIPWPRLRVTACYSSIFDCCSESCAISYKLSSRNRNLKNITKSSMSSLLLSLSLSVRLIVWKSSYRCILFSVIKFLPFKSVLYN